ncbi:MAG: cytochrome P450, partial [Candidatus Nanopelagicales bacterium]
MPLPRPVPITAPGPTGADMLRSVLRIRRDPVAFLQSVRDRHGGVAQFPIPRPPTYLVSDAGAVRRVLVTNAGAYGKRTLQYSTLSLVTGNGLLTADTETWRPHRRILQPAFHHIAVAAVAGHVARAVARVDRTWSARCQASAATKAVVDVDETMAVLALEVVGRALFGTDLTGDAARLTSATLKALDVVVARARTPVSAPSWLPTPGNVRLGRAVARLDAAVVSMLAQRAHAGTAPHVPDMLDLLLASGELTPTEVRDEVVTFIVAGHETVAAALTWACYLLGRYPVAAQRLRDEVDGVTAGRDQPF